MFLALGSNCGLRRRNMRRARALLSGEEGIEVVATSFLYKTSPIGYTPQRDFLNGVVEIRALQGPSGLWERIRGVEKRMGKRVLFHNGPRNIDIDLLLYGKRIVRERGLVVPHPRFHTRRFVLAPLAEIAPDVVHPLLGETVSTLLGRCEGGLVGEERKRW